MHIPSAPQHGEGGSERWLITYADMITLLLVMFVVLFAFANTDLEKFKALAESLAEGFGATSKAAGATEGASTGSEAGSSPVFDTSGGGEAPLEMFPEQQTPIKILDFAEMLEGTGEAGGLREQLEQLIRQANADAAGELGGLAGQLQVSYNEKGIVITIFPDQILFDSGSARLKAGFKHILETLAPQLRRLPNGIEVDGHTDNLPISTAAFPSNWELSAGRAGAVVRYLQALGLPPERLSAAGYADTRPVDSNATRAGRLRNRRVEIIVLRDAGETLPSASAPAAAGATSGGQRGD
jgi:chemotaxis protein MotB